MLKLVPLVRGFEANLSKVLMLEGEYCGISGRKDHWILASCWRTDVWTSRRKTTNESAHEGCSLLLLGKQKWECWILLEILTLKFYGGFTFDVTVLVSLHVCWRTVSLPYYMFSRHARSLVVEWGSSYRRGSSSSLQWGEFHGRGAVRTGAEYAGRARLGWWKEAPSSTKRTSR